MQITNSLEELTLLRVSPYIKWIMMLSWIQQGIIGQLGIGEGDIKMKELPSSPARRRKVLALYW